MQAKYGRRTNQQWWWIGLMKWMNWFSTSRGRCIPDWRKQMRVIDVQNYCQRQRVIEVDLQEGVQNQTVQVAPNQTG